jgi:hypothetical protein
MTLDNGLDLTLEGNNNNDNNNNNNVSQILRNVDGGLFQS